MRWKGSKIVAWTVHQDVTQWMELLALLRLLFDRWSLKYMQLAKPHIVEIYDTSLQNLGSDVEEISPPTPSYFLSQTLCCTSKFKYRLLVVVPVPLQQRDHHISRQEAAPPPSPTSGTSHSLRRLNSIPSFSQARHYPQTLYLNAAVRSIIVDQRKQSGFVRRTVHSPFCPLAVPSQRSPVSRTRRLF